MAELNIGALTDSKSYTGSVGTTNIFDLYKFNINSPGSFKFAIDGLSGNADIFLLNNSGTTLYSSTNAGTGAETISVDSLVAGDYAVKVLPITGDIKYTLNLVPANTQKSSDADTLTGAKSNPLSASTSSTTAEKSTANKDVITGSTVGDKTVTTEAKSATTDKQVSADSQVTTKSEPEKTVTVTENAIYKSSTSDKSVIVGSETSIKSEPEKPATIESAIDTSITSTKPVITDSENSIKLEQEKPTTATETVATKEPKTGETIAAVTDTSKPAEKPSPATTNGEDKKTENPNTSIPTAETTKELDSSTKKEIVVANPFTSGTFVVDSTGKVGIDYLLDGGLYRGQLAIISLKGMDKFVPGSEEFIKEAAARALSNSEKGHIVIDDLSEGARFSGNLPEGNYNEGSHLGVKTFAMTPGDEFGIMLVPNDTFKFLSDYPTFGGDKRPLFSMVTANPNEAFHLGQIADINGEGNTFAMEDMRFDAGSDKDYNDITFQVRGAKGKAPLMDSLVNPDKDWRQTDLGKAVIAYATPYITPEPETKPNLEGEVSDAIDELEKEILNPSPSEKETPRDTESAADTEKDTEDSGIDEIISMPPSKTEEKAKDSASNSGESPQVETKDQVEANPTTVPTADKDAAVDSTEKSPVEKTLVSTEVTEVKDKVTEAPATTNVPDKSTIEMEVAATITEKVEVKPEVLPAESKVKEETKPEVLPAETKAEEESKPTLVTEVEKTETPQVVVTENPVESVKESQPTATVEPKETVEVKPSLPVKQTDLDTMPVTTTNNGEELQTKDIVCETPAVSDVVIPKDSLPTLPIADESTENDSTTAENPPPPIDLVPTGSEIDYSLPANLIARLESMKQSLTNLGSAGDPSGNSSNETLIARLESVTQKLMTFNESTPVSDKTVTLVDRLEETVDRLIQPPIQPPLQSIDASQFDFPVGNQPIIGVIDTGFAGNNPDIDYSRITWGQDKVDGDADPRIEAGKGNEHGTHVLGIIAATQNNGIGIDGVNEKAPVWAGRAIGSGKWAESLVEFVNTAIESNQPNAVVNLSLDLTQINPDGSVTTRYEFTPEERSAIEYARQHNVLLVVAAGNDGGVMSVLGQASQEFDNIITVGAAERVNDEIALSKAFDRAEYSSYGRGLDIVAPGGTVQYPEFSTVGDGIGTMAGTSVATAKVTGAVSQVWAANPSLSYRQVIQIIKDTATDLKTSNWDDETGVGLLNMVAAVHLAEATTGKAYQPIAFLTPNTWGGEGKVTPTERAVNITNENFSAWVVSSNGITLRNSPNTSDRSNYVVNAGDTLNFDGWTYGETLNDLTTGEPDALWYRFRYNGGTYWVPSAWTGGYPGSQPPLLPQQQQLQPPPQSGNNDDWQTAINNEYQQTQGLLGNPKNGTYFNATTSPAGTTGKGKDYEWGSIHWSQQYGAVALWRDLQREYEEYSSPNGSGGWLGFPTRREYDWNGGKRTDFEGGYIYWDGQKAKAYRLWELPSGVSVPDWETAIENEFQQTRGLLGNPRNGTYFNPTTSPAGTTGKGKDYEWGSIHWSQQYGAVALWRDLQREYEEYSSPNGSGGWLGFPTRREYDWNGGRRTDFEGGYIYWDGQRAKAYRLGELPQTQSSPEQEIAKNFLYAASLYPQVGAALTGVQDQGGGVFRQEFERAIMIWNGQQVVVTQTKGSSSSPTSPSPDPKANESGYNLDQIPSPWQNVARPYISLLVQAFASQGITNPRVLAYAAATIGPESSWNPNAKNTTDPAANTGYPGAGLAQVTWDYNYKAVSNLTGIDFYNHPEYMFDPLNSLKAKAAFLKMNNMIPLIEAGFYESAAGIYNANDRSYRSTYTAKVAAAVPTWMGVFS
jgi:Subtilase family/Domain of unknown function (DUF4114)/Bacterial pre-peptidase C-terminal domain/LGFP repeat